MLTDSLSLFYVITKATMTTEKQLMADPRSLKYSYNRVELQNVAFVVLELIFVDSLTK